MRIRPRVVSQYMKDKVKYDMVPRGQIVSLTEHVTKRVLHDSDECEQSYLPFDFLATYVRLIWTLRLHAGSLVTVVPLIPVNRPLK